MRMLLVEQAQYYDTVRDKTQCAHYDVHKACDLTMILIYILYYCCRYIIE